MRNTWLFLLLLTGCATYRATPLTPITAEVKPSKKLPLALAAHEFSSADCKKYLDRDVLRKGYQPIQIQIQNFSDKTYLFSTSRLNLPCATPQEVADRVHTSTVGRVAGYGAAAVLTCGLFVIPAVVDGVKSAGANEALDHDFARKAAKDQEIAPYETVNMLVFVPVASYRSRFDLTLLDKDSQKPLTFNLTAQP